MNELPDLRQMSRVCGQSDRSAQKEQKAMTPSSLNTDTSHAQGAGGVVDKRKNIEEIT